MATQKKEEESQIKQGTNKELAKEAKESNMGKSCNTSEPHYHHDQHDHDHHAVVHGISSKEHYIVNHLADDGSGDRAEGCHATSQADHFKCVH
ncbi:hypothetical protein L484_023723 [Morus notabilis]|uniref:Uncharacterized protein n=1 Tax=Morus notabilis TaxID=981085 RepID=W9QR20_9ROSA|nr:hypothetical protein L484_023723 [Morus notabilis]